jgi:hypothetical protein
MSMVGSPLAASQQFGLNRLGDFTGYAGAGASAGLPTEKNRGATEPTGSSKAKGLLARLSPEHRLFLYGAFAVVGLALFGYSTEGRIGGHAGPLHGEVEAGLE